MASGATVIVTSSSDNKLEIAKKLGAHHLINYSKIPEWHTEVLKITNGRGVDRTIEVGGPGTLAKSLQATRRSGFISIVGALDLVCVSNHQVSQTQLKTNGRGLDLKITA